MKKLIAFLLCLALCLPGLCASAEETEQEEFTSGDYKYIKLEDGTTAITGYTGEVEALVIPETLDGLSVTAIGDYAFLVCSSLTSVTIPDSVCSIGANPFGGCEKLTNIIVSPDNPALAVIDGILFSKADRCLICYPAGITDFSYVIPQGITAIGENAFCGCDSLTSVTIPDSVTTIGDYAFLCCFSLTSVTIPDSVTTIGDYAFCGCDSLTSVTIPDSVTFIGDSAFSECDSLKTVTVERGSYAHEYCKEHGLPFTFTDANDEVRI